MFGWLRGRTSAPPIPDALWDQVLRRYSFLAQRPPHERVRLRALAAQFLATKEFHGAQGFVITDDVALSIAAQAVLPVLNLGLKWYDDFVGIVVHDGQVVARRTATDDAGVVHQWDDVLAGEAMDRGPVMLNWQDVHGAGATAGQGYNLVIHEFAHKLDLRDGRADGCPPLASAAARRQWLATLQGQYQAFRENVIVAERFGGDVPWLDAYGATAIDEFFAVACEAYFVNRDRFQREFPALVTLFDPFFRL
ncbi:MAG: zinc-dependent peptidase [Variovorax sp.]